MHVACSGLSRRVLQPTGRPLPGEMAGIYQPRPGTPGKASIAGGLGLVRDPVAASRAAAAVDDPRPAKRQNVLCKRHVGELHEPGGAHRLTRRRSHGGGRKSDDPSESTLRLRMRLVSACMPGPRLPRCSCRITTPLPSGATFLYVPGQTTQGPLPGTGQTPDFTPAAWLGRFWGLTTLAGLSGALTSIVVSLLTSTTDGVECADRSHGKGRF